MSISLWSSDEQAWIPKPCGCCSQSQKLEEVEAVWCNRFGCLKATKEFCSEWLRRVNET